MERHVDEDSYRHLVGSAAELLATYFIGFVNLQVRDGEADASIGGSGTLVSIGDVKGVLTAGHVIRSIMRREVVGIVFAFGAAQRLTFKTEYCKPTELLGEEESDGPDLGFLILPPDTTSALEAIMSFYNLSKHADRMLAKPPPLDHGFWGITGFPEEFTTAAEIPLKGFSKGKNFKGGFGAGVVTGEEQRGAFDYVTYEALYNEHYEGPESFAGFSGGGLWQLLVNLKPEKPEIRERLLIGVAFYETKKHQTPEGLVRHVICHGKKSLYQILPKKIQS